MALAGKDDDGAGTGGGGRCQRLSEPGQQRVCGQAGKFRSGCGTGACTQTTAGTQRGINYGFKFETG